MSSNTQLPPIPDNIVLFTGPALIGINLNWFFFGILLVQYYFYCTSFSNDKKWIAALVHIIFIIESAQTAMTTVDGFHWFAVGFGNVNLLSEYYLSTFNSPMMSAVVGCIAQSFFNYRILCLGQWRVFCVILEVLIVVATGGGLGLGIMNQKAQTITTFFPQTIHFAYLWLTMCAAIDLTIASSMTYLLLRPQSEVASSTKSIIARILTLTIETNSMTAAASVILLCLGTIPSIAPPKTSIFLCPGYILGKLYSNSFMALLNNRAIVNNFRVVMSNTNPTFSLQIRQQTQTESTSPDSHHNKRESVQLAGQDLSEQESEFTNNTTV